MKRASARSYFSNPMAVIRLCSAWSSLFLILEWVHFKILWAHHVVDRLGWPCWSSTSCETPHFYTQGLASSANARNQQLWHWCLPSCRFCSCQCQALCYVTSVTRFCRRETGRSQTHLSSVSRSKEAPPCFPAACCSELRSEQFSRHYLYRIWFQNTWLRLKSHFLECTFQDTHRCNWCVELDTAWKALKVSY